MIWADLDFDERLRTLYLAAREGTLAKQIAYDASTTSQTIITFARANGIPVRTRVPGLRQVVVRKRVPLNPAKLSPLISVVTPTRTNGAVDRRKILAGQRELAHART